LAYQALYRKYRPMTFSDVVGQEHITETLKQELIEDKISHAYLFTGTRGTGKTTCAKILAKAVSCLSPVNGDPCGECEMCRAVAEDEITDIVEIDAASNNGVDNIRELREQIAFPPATSKYRVYIIDEVHMLSQGAFNALLKTLEEPPSYVIFVLATTEVHKLPATILSRCQRFDFRRIDSSKICQRIATVAEKEGLTVTEDAALLIASAADGGMRDALSILDLCASANRNIDEDVVVNVCAMAGNEYLLKMADLIKNRDTEGALMLVDELHNSSVDMMRLLSELTNHYRNLMIVKTVKSKEKPVVCSAAQLRALENQAEKYDIRDIMDILTVLQSAAAKMPSANRRCEMEMTIIRLCNPQVFTDLTALEKRVSALETSGVTVTVPTTVVPVQTEKNVEVAETVSQEEHKDNNISEDFADGDEIPLPEPPPEENFEAPIEASESKPQKRAPVTVPDGITFVTDWDKIVSKLRITCPLIAGVLGDSCAYIKGDYLLIDAPNSQFKTMVGGSNTIYRDRIRKAAEEILGKTYKLGPYKKETVAESDPLLSFAQKLKDFQN